MIDMLFVVRRLQELGRQRKTPLYMCSIDLQKSRLCRTESCCGRYSQALAYQPKCIQLFVISMKACELACVRVTASTRNGLMSRRGCGKAESGCGRYSNALAYRPRCIQLFVISMEACELACVRMTGSTRNGNGLMSRRGCGKDACYLISPLLVQRVLRCCVTRRTGTLRLRRSHRKGFGSTH